MDAKVTESNCELRLDALQASAKRRLRVRETGSGVMTLPAAPSLLSRYTEKLVTAFALLGRPASKKDEQTLAEILGGVMREAWEHSPFARVIAHYSTADNPDDGINYHFEIAKVSIGEEYDTWVKARPRPFFGANPNARVLHVARSLGKPSQLAVLDVGAADGRNTIPLAREGYATDAVELSPEFAKILRERVLQERLVCCIYTGDFLNRELAIGKAYYDLVLLVGVVVAHVRTVEHLRALLERASEVLKPGGVVLFSIFRTLHGFEPDPHLRELAELFWTVMFTPAEIEAALEGLPLRVVHDVPYVAYEREHAPETWPPTEYFEAYCAGQDLFDLPAGKAPLQMRWITCRKEGEPAR
jgi:SAM-dependent methyltransferase